MIPVEDRTKEMREVLTKLGIFLAIALFAWFIWPTRYERGERKVGQTVYPTRIHRISRRVELLTPFGWEVVGYTPDPDPTDIPAADIAKIMLRCEATPFDVLECDVLNNTNWSLSELNLTVRVLNKNGSEARKRLYVMTADSRLRFDPGETTKGLVELDFPLEPGQSRDWKLIGAKGVKSY
jgi:hypothetical protein